MNRAFPLIVLTLAAAGGLAFLATRPADFPQADGDSQPGLDRNAASNTPAVAPSTGLDESSLAAIPEERRKDPVDTTGQARLWEVIPMNSKGQLLAEARITATPSDGGGAEESLGRTRWDAPKAGAWALTIEADGLPTWSREVVLERGKTLRTTAWLGDEIRITGRVMDSHGNPIVRTPVYLLPRGAQHPKRRDMTAQVPGNDRAPNLPANGAIAAMTDAGGRFKTRLPQGGDWRVSVGRPSKARWEQSAPITLRNGGPDVAEVVLPALASFELELDAEKEDWPSEVQVFVYDAEMALRAAAEQAERLADAANSDGIESIADAQRAAKERAAGGKGGGRGGSRGKGGGGGGRKNGTARTSKEENEILAAKGRNGELDPNGGGRSLMSMGGLIGPGYRMVKSGRIDGEGKTQVLDLPGGEDLMFLFRRGKASIATTTPYRLRKSSRSKIKATVPSKSSMGSQLRSKTASLQVTTTPDEPDSTHAVGVTWGY